MIKINLLPVEKRKAEKTPLPRFLLIAGTAVVAAVAVLANVVVYLQILGIESDIRSNKETLERLAPRVAEHDKLQARVAQLRAKVNEIESLVKREVEFWRAVNAVWDVIQANPRVWIDDIRILEANAATSELKRSDPDSKDGSPYGITMRCHVAGEEVEEMTKFRGALKENPFLKEYLTVLNFNVDWKVDAEKDFPDPHSISFQVSLMGPMNPPTKVKPGAAPKPAAGAAQGGAAPAGAAPPGTAPASAPAPQGGQPR